MAPRENGTKDTSETKTGNGSDFAPAITITAIQQQETPIVEDIADTAMGGSGDTCLEQKETGNADATKPKDTVPQAIVVQNGTDDPAKVGDGDPFSWQTKYESLSTRYGELFLRGLWTDCEFIGITEQPIKAHRVILACASPVLANLLYNNNSITLHNIDPEPFKLLLEYIYTNNIDIPSCEMACRLYKAAHYFIIPHLENKIKTYLLENVDIECVIFVYEFSKEFDVEEVSKKCLKIMSDQAEEILAGQGLESAHEDTLESVFGIEQMNIASEMQLFKAAERWVQARIKKTFQNSNDNNNGDDNNDPLLVGRNHETFYSMYVKQEAKTKIRKAVQQIRFLTMEPQEFSEYDTTFLLSESDISAISLNMMSAKTYMPMPKGFSTLRNYRNYKTYTVRVSTSEGLSSIFTSVPSPFTSVLCNDKPFWRLDLQFSAPHGVYNGWYCKINLICGDKTYEPPWSINSEVILTILRIGGDSKWNWKVKHVFNSCDRRKTDGGVYYTFTPDLNWTELKNDKTYTEDNVVTFEVKIRVLNIGK